MRPTRYHGRRIEPNRHLTARGRRPHVGYHGAQHAGMAGGVNRSDAIRFQLGGGGFQGHGVQLDPAHQSGGGEADRVVLQFGDRGGEWTKGCGGPQILDSRMSLVRPDRE